MLRAQRFIPFCGKSPGPSAVVNLPVASSTLTSKPPGTSAACDDPLITAYSPCPDLGVCMTTLVPSPCVLPILRMIWGSRCRFPSSHPSGENSVGFCMHGLRAAMITLVRVEDRLGSVSLPNVVLHRVSRSSRVGDFSHPRPARAEFAMRSMRHPRDLKSWKREFILLCHFKNELPSLVLQRLSSPPDD